MTLSEQIPPDPRCIALVRHLRSAFNTEARALDAAGGRPLRAYLVLENWHAGALTAAIGEHHPAMAEDRVTVPDPHFKHREEDAPCLLQLPQHWADSSTDPMLARLAASDLPGWLAQAWVQAEQRQMQQPLCGVLFSDSIAVAIASHWAVLGDQLSPADGSARLLRYQDPRVLQRAWPVLSDAQRRQWLGPVRRWWTLEQPWGPWALVDLVQQDVSATSREPEWFQAFANPAGDTEPLSSSALGRLSFDLPQWWAAHSSPAGHRVWARLAGNGVRVDRQPDGAAMSRLLAQGRSLSLGGDDLEDFVDLTWRAHPTQDTKREAFWQSPSEAALLARVMDTLRRQPDLRFGTAYADAVSSR